MAHNFSYFTKKKIPFVSQFYIFFSNDMFFINHVLQFKYPS